MPGMVLCRVEKQTKGIDSPMVHLSGFTPHFAKARPLATQRMKVPGML